MTIGSSWIPWIAASVAAVGSWTCNNDEGWCRTHARVGGRGSASPAMSSVHYRDIGLIPASWVVPADAGSSGIAQLDVGGREERNKINIAILTWECLNPPSSSLALVSVSANRPNRRTVDVVRWEAGNAGAGELLSKDRSKDRSIL